MTERKETGRIYIQNVDHCNFHGAFIPEVAPIKMTNLCVDENTIVTILRESGTLEECTIRDLGAYVLSEDVRILSRNNITGQNDFMLVKAWAKTGSKQKVVKVTDETTGKFVICTPEHEIYTTNRGYVEAQNLLPEDLLLID
jgi:ribonucleotide reductase alpha subunit